MRAGGKARGSEGGKRGGHQSKMVESLMNTTTVCSPASSIEGGVMPSGPPQPPTLRSDDCVRHFKEEKKYINMYKYSLLT